MTTKNLEQLRQAIIGLWLFIIESLGLLPDLGHARSGLVSNDAPSAFAEERILHML
jgi:hypothetical protein